MSDRIQLASSTSHFNYGAPLDASSTTTVRLGENTLSDVSRNRNVDPAALLAANPQISDAYATLSVGQEIHLPFCQAQDPESTPAGQPFTGRAQASVGDPLAKSVVQANFKSKAELPKDEQAIQAMYGENGLRSYREAKSPSYPRKDGDPSNLSVAASSSQSSFWTRFASTRAGRALFVALKLSAKDAEGQAEPVDIPEEVTKGIEDVTTDASRVKSTSNGGAAPPDDPPVTPDLEPGSTPEGTRIATVDDYTHDYGRAQVHESGVSEGGAGGGAANGVESNVLRETNAAEGMASKVATASRVGSLIEAAVPGPDQIAFIGYDFFASIAEAKEDLKATSFSTGFSDGLAARLLGLQPDWVLQNLGEKPDIAPGDWGPAKANANNLGVQKGYRDFGSQLARQPDTANAWLSKGIKVLRDQRQSGINLSNPTLDDVLSLGWALRPSVNTMFAGQAKHEEQVEEQKRKQRLDDRLCIGNRC